MTTPKLLVVVGTKKSEKTTVVEHIISGLTRKGFRIGSIKHIHHPDFTIDSEGTDTWRHAQPGSRIVATLSKNETALIIRDDLESTLPSAPNFMMNQGLDMIVIEGLHSSMGQRTDIFKVITAHDSEDLKERINNTAPPIVAISRVIAEKASSLPDNNVPVINAMTNSAKLIEKIENEVLRNKN